MTKYVTHKLVTMMIRIASEFVIAGSRTKAFTMEAPVPNHVTPMTDLILARVTMTGYFMGKTTQRHLSTLMKNRVPMEAALNANDSTMVVLCRASGFGEHS